MGTFAKRGRCRAIVVATGVDTEFGRTATEMKDAGGPQRSPLQQGMDDLGKRLSFASVCVIVIIGLCGVARGEKLLDVFTIGVSLAVAAIPEGLPICVAVTLALGVMRMARRNAVVKRLPAVEALGCADVVCVDKTGTLTVNEMALAELWIPSETTNGHVQKDIRLRRTNGSFQLLVDGVEQQEDLPDDVAATLDAAVVCSDAELANDVGIGLPTEVAILRAARDLGIPDRRSRLNRVAEVPFTSERKRMDVVVEPIHNNARAARVPIAYVKGAYEAMKSDLVDVDDVRVQQAASDLANRGLRVVAIATSAPDDYRRSSSRQRKRPPQQKPRSFNFWGTSSSSSSPEENEEDVEDDDDKEEMSVVDLNNGTKSGPLVLRGLAALSDPARPTASAAVQALQERGIRVVMLTGDGRETARAIAKDVGIPAELDASGQDIDRWVQFDEVKKNLQRGISVLYRVSPRHKLEIVRALQRGGSVVAMTGDGVNDAPALRHADIGVAMGGPRGTDVATEAADVVLTDDDVLSIVAAVDEGKAIFHNIRNFITFQLSTSFAALGLVAVAHLLDFPSPLNAMQVLWINIIMDGPPAQSLGTEAVDTAVTRSPPRHRTEPIVTERIFIRVVTSAMLICAGTLAVFASELGDDEEHRRATTMTFTTFVMYDMFNALACRSDTAIVGTKRLGLFTNRAFCLAVGGSILGQLFVIYWAPLQAIFQTEALALVDLLKVLAVAATVLVLDVFRKVNLFGFQPVVPVQLKGNTHGAFVSFFVTLF